MGFNSIVGAFKTAFDGVLKAMGPVGDMFRTMGQALNTVYSGVVGFFNSAINFLPGIGPALAGAALRATGVSLGAQIVNMAISTGLTIGVSKGLESLGVSPQLSSFFGNLAAGAIIGGLRPETMAGGHVAISQAQNIQASVQSSILINNVGRLGTELGLDPNFTSVIGLSLGAIQGHLITNPGSSLELAFNEIKPELFSSLAQYGVTALGTSLGMDYRLSGLIGSPISAGIGAAFGQGLVTGTQIINSINDGLLRGAISLGVNYATQNLDPLLAAASVRLASSVLIDVFHVGRLNPNFDPTKPESTTNLRYLESQGLMGDAVNSFLDSFRSFSVLGVNGDDSWSRAQYLQRLLNVSSTIQTQGFAKAMDNLATQVMTEDAINDLVKVSGTVKAYIQSALDNNQTQVVIRNGVSYQQINLKNGDYLLRDIPTGNLIEFKKGNEVYSGQIAQDPYGAVILVNGTKTVVDGSNNPILIYQYKDGVLGNVVFRAVNQSDPTKSELYSLTITQGTGSNASQVLVKNLSTGKNYTVTDKGVAETVDSSSDSSMDILWTQAFFPGLSNTDFDNTAKSIIGQRAAQIALEKELQSDGGPYMDIMLGAKVDSLGNPYSFLSQGGIGADAQYLEDRANFNMSFLLDDAFNEVKNKIIDTTKDYLQNVGLDTLKNVFEVGFSKQLLTLALQNVQKEAAMTALTTGVEDQAARYVGYSSGNLLTKSISTLASLGTWFSVAVATTFSLFNTTNAGSYTEVEETNYQSLLLSKIKLVSDMDNLINVAPTVDLRLQYLLEKQSLSNDAISVVESQISSVENELKTNKALDSQSKEDLFTFRDKLLIDWQVLKTKLHVE